MNLIINASLNYIGGGLQVALSFIEECITIENNNYHIFISENLENQLTLGDYPANFVFYKIPSLKFYQYNSFLSKLEEDICPDIVFSVFSPVYWRPKAIHISGFAMGHYLYDDSPLWKIASLRYKAIWKFKKNIHSFYLKRDVDVYIVETKDACNRLVRLYNKPCYVVSNTYNKYFDLFKCDCRNRTNFLPDVVENEFRLLSVCSSYLHKNLTIIPLVIEQLNKKGYYNMKFILTVSEADYTKIIPPKYRCSVINVGVIPSNSVPQLYSECNAVFVPSLLECFTANFPEAMIMEKPILASDLGFSRTICKDSALYFNPLNSSDIANAIINIYNDPSLRTELISKGKEQISSFMTAKERACSYIEICLKILNEKYV